jgi:DNA polymerase-3 subunit epsilon
MSKWLWFDTETTGIDHKKNSLLQIACIVEIDKKVEEIFNIKCRPIPGQEISEEALKVNNLTIEEINSWPLPYKLYIDLKEKFEKYIDKFDRSDKFIIAGHNITFDYNFLDSFFRNLGDDYLGSYLDTRARIDTKEVANFLKIMGKLKVEDIKLKTLCNYFNIQINPHEALSDIISNRKVFIEMLRLIDGEKFDESKNS